MLWICIFLGLNVWADILNNLVLVEGQCDIFQHPVIFPNDSYSISFFLCTSILCVFESGVWDLIVLVPGLCLYFYFRYLTFQNCCDIFQIRS